MNQNHVCLYPGLSSAIWWRNQKAAVLNNRPSSLVFVVCFMEFISASTSKCLGGIIYQTVIIYLSLRYSICHTQQNHQIQSVPRKTIKCYGTECFLAGATEPSVKCLPCKEEPAFNPQNLLTNKLGTVTEKPQHQAGGIDKWLPEAQ